jgi:hypothetical protein
MESPALAGSVASGGNRMPAPLLVMGRKPMRCQGEDQFHRHDSKKLKIPGSRGESPWELTEQELTCHPSRLAGRRCPMHAWDDTGGWHERIVTMPPPRNSSSPHDPPTMPGAHQSGRHLPFG